MRGVLRRVIILLVLSWAAQAAAAAEPDRQADPAARATQLAAQREQVAIELADAELAAAHRAALESLRQLLQERWVLATRQVDAERDRQQLAAERQAGLAASWPHPPPYSWGELDELLDDREALSAQLTALSEEVAAAGGGPAPTEVHPNDLVPAELSSRLAANEAALAEERQAVRAAEVALAEARLAWLDERLSWTRSNLRPARGELDRRLAVLADRRAETERDRQQAALELSEAEARWRETQQQVDSALQVEPAGEQQLAARRLALDRTRDEVARLEARLQRHGWQQEAIQARFVLLSGQHGTSAELRAAEATLDERQAELDRQRQGLNGRLEVLRGRQLQIQDRLAEAAEGSAQRLWLVRQERDAGRWKAFLERELELLEAAEPDFSRFLAELRDELGRRSMALWAGRAWDRLKAIWTLPLTEVQGGAITVGALIGALLLLGIGIVVSRGLARFFAARLLSRLRLDAGAVATFQTLLFYFLLVLVVLWALRQVGIPLTAFTVLGGALAIGVGFGSQNIVNNFISGLILMAERPIRVGDLVEHDGVVATVEHIGARSTRVRTGSNTHIVVPNSALLENSVINWTLSDQNVRCTVEVGVAYGSPVREVERIFIEVLQADESVRSSPRPEVLFEEFGDNSLLFRGYFWARVRADADRRRVASRLRFALDARFAEAGITIAFPQRDVHLDSLRPIEVRLTGERPDEGGTPG